MVTSCLSTAAYSGAASLMSFLFASSSMELTFSSSTLPKFWLFVFWIDAPSTRNMKLYGCG